MDRELIWAVRENDLTTVRSILQQPGVNVNARLHGLTALHIAAGVSNLAILQAVLQSEHVNVNARSSIGDTPLHWACSPFTSDHQLQGVRALLEAGADPNPVDGSLNESPLDTAIRSSTASVVEALLDGGANLGARSMSQNDTPLHRACEFMRPEVVQSLIRRHGPECLTLKNVDGRPPLDCLPHASLPFYKQEPVAAIRRFILQAYAGMLAQRDGLLCLHQCLQDVTFLGGEDSNRFELPVGRVDTEILQILLECLLVAQPGSIRARNGTGLLPLQVASELNFPDLVVNVLLRPYPGALLLL